MERSEKLWSEARNHGAKREIMERSEKSWRSQFMTPRVNSSAPVGGGSPARAHPPNFAAGALTERPPSRAFPPVAAHIVRHGFPRLERMNNES